MRRLLAAAVAATTALAFLGLFSCSEAPCPTCGATKDTGSADAGADASCETANVCGGCARIDAEVGACCGAGLCIKCYGTETFRCTICVDSGCS